MFDELVLEAITREVEGGALPPDAGIAVAVVAGGRVVHRGAYGLRERDRALPVTPRTTFELCSLTKAFTAAGLAMAAEAGTLDLDRPINASSSLLALSDEALTREVTVADILSHRTGVAASDLLWYFGQTKRGGVRAAIEHLPVIDGAFRRSFVYSNLLYGALGEVYPQLTGASWETRVTEGLLRPLGMSATTFGPTEEPEIALPYVGTRRVPAADASAVAAAGGMRSTLDDMARWLAFWVSGGRAPDGTSLVGERVVARMFEPAVAFGDASPILLNGLDWASADLHYGLGWFVGQYEKRRIAFHPGFIDGYSNVMAVLPDEGLGVVVLSNVNFCGAVGRLVRALVDADTSGSVMEPVPDPHAELAGRYQHPRFGPLVVARHGSRWTVEYGGQAWPLTWQEDGSAQAAATLFGLTIPFPVVFRVVEGGAVVDVPLSMDPRVPPERFVRQT
jgi:CubicO group peptidase (beta-lactamase class C family)